jgi:hypothetical protein
VLAASASAGSDPLIYGARRFRGLRKIMTTSNIQEMESLHF